MTISPDIAAIIPHFQRRSGLLPHAVRSVFSQTCANRLLVIVCDDSSPVSAQSELRQLADLPQDRIVIVSQPNAGAGAARNRALDHIPPGIRYVAFIDSDDAWRPDHIARAMAAIDRGMDAYFADFIAVGHPGIGNMQRIGTLRATDNEVLDAELGMFKLSVSALEHIVSDGGGLVQTSTVVYRFDRYRALRFREEFFNGQDFFFWVDLGEAGAQFGFSFAIECDNGEGINIFQASGWGTEKSLQRLRNELFVWTSMQRLYDLPPRLRHANKRTIRNLQTTLADELLHRLRRLKPIPMRLVKDIVRMAPSTLLITPMAVARALLRRLSR